jgi:hypothetical protein
MKPMLFTLAAAGTLAALPALAQTMPAIADADGSGNWSLAELQVAYPDLTAETFTAVDADASGAVDQTELAAALADGVLPAASGG